MLPSTHVLLTIRAVLNGLLLFILAVGVVALFLEKSNGVARAMAWVGLGWVGYVGVVLFISLVDLAPPEMAGVRRAEVAVWSVVTALLLLAHLWLGWKIWRDR